MGNTLSLRKTAEAIHTTHSHGAFVIAVYKMIRKEHVVLIKGDITEKEDVTVRIQSACIPGTVLDSADCECRDQLMGAFDILDQKQNGVILYMDEEGRGHGLTIKILGLKNKNRGLDTFKAIESLGLPSDVRNYQEAAMIIKNLRMKSIKLITNNPDKIEGLIANGIIVSERIPIEIQATARTKKHLAAKKRAGHMLKQKL